MSNPLLIAAKAARNPLMRPARRREVQLAALDHLWSTSRPPDGSRLRQFDKAYAEVLRMAGELQIDSELFDAWADALEFECGDCDAGLVDAEGYRRA